MRCARWQMRRPSTLVVTEADRPAPAGRRAYPFSDRCARNGNFDQKRATHLLHNEMLRFGLLTSW